MGNHNTILAKMQDKHTRGLLLADSYRRLGMDRLADTVTECGTYLGFAQDGEGVKLMQANFCKAKLCPSCQWRRSLRIYGATSQIMDHLDATRTDIKYLFLTLTVRNVPADKLSETIDTMAKAYHHMTRNSAWQRRVKGAMRTLEVTVNHTDQTYHPHYHLILVVDKSYATKADKTYWTHDDWQHAWRLAAKLDYDPQVSISAVKGKRKGVREVSKYMAKDTDYILPEDQAETDRVVYDLTDGLHKRRLISYTGVMRQARLELRIKDPETAPLTDDIRGDVASAIMHYHWSTGLGRYVPGPRGGR